MPYRMGPWEIAIILPTLVIYFIPTIIVIIRRVRNTVGILLLNIFGGWTFVGWVIALVWAIIDKKQDESK